MQLQNIIIIKILLISIFYSTLRYNIFGNVPWQDFPLFIFNKAISFSIILLLFINQIGSLKKKRGIDAGGEITLLVLLHVILSIILQNPEYYDKFYFENKLNLIGSLSLLFGIFAFLGFCLIIFMKLAKANDSVLQSQERIEKIKILSFILISIHLFVMGITGWLVPINWPGYMPPISLISFLLILIILFINIKK